MLRLVPLALTLAVSACTSVNFVLLGVPTTRPGVDVEHVRVYLNETDVYAPYEKVALLFGESRSELGNEAKVIRAMQKKAGELGADGIILLSLGEGYPNRLFDLGDEHRGRAIAIRLIQDG